MLLIKLKRKQLKSNEKPVVFKFGVILTIYIMPTRSRKFSLSVSSLTSNKMHFFPLNANLLFYRKSIMTYLERRRHRISYT
jgi:hypothetical protein